MDFLEMIKSMWDGKKEPATSGSGSGAPAFTGSFSNGSPTDSNGGSYTVAPDNVPSPGTPPSTIGSSQFIRGPGVSAGKFDTNSVFGDATNIKVLNGTLLGNLGEDKKKEQEVLGFQNIQGFKF